MNDESGQFSAADSALGYLYQARVALVWSLQRLKENPDLVVALETLDDVVFESRGAPTELLQTNITLRRQHPSAIHLLIFGNHYASGSQGTPMGPFRQVRHCIC